MVLNIEIYFNHKVWSSSVTYYNSKLHDKIDILNVKTILCQ